MQGMLTGPPATGEAARAGHAAAGYIHPSSAGRPAFGLAERDHPQRAILGFVGGAPVLGGRFSVNDIPPQGYAPQGYPPQGYAPQGYPQQPYVAPNVVRSNLITPLADVAAVAILIWLYSLRSYSSFGALIVAGSVLVLAGFTVWRWLCGFTVEFDQVGVSISTRLWQMRGKPPIRLPWTVGIFATTSGVLWHRSVAINSVHLEAPDIWSFKAIRTALLEKSIPVTEEPTTLMNAVGIGLFVAAYVAVVALRVGLIPWVVAYGVVLALAVIHTVDKDDQWLRVADYSAALQRVGALPPR